MKPLSDSETFLKRFNHFKNGELRSIEILSPTSFLVTLAAQDEARGFDWKSVRLEFSQITDARLLEDKKYALVDMNDGISIIKNDNILAFAIGECYNISNIETSACYIQAKYIKYEEDNF